MKLTKVQARNELRRLMDSLCLTSGSPKIRTELSGLVEDLYIQDIISRNEYQQFMGDLK